MSTIVDNVIKDVENIPQQPRTAAPMPTGAVNGAPKPYVNDPATVARTEAPAAAAPEPAKVIRRSFGR
jgi:hypothetical protein